MIFLAYHAILPKIHHPYNTLNKAYAIFKQELQQPPAKQQQNEREVTEVLLNECYVHRLPKSCKTFYFLSKLHKEYILLLSFPQALAFKSSNPSFIFIIVHPFFSSGHFQN